MSPELDRAEQGHPDQEETHTMNDNFGHRDEDVGLENEEQRLERLNPEAPADTAQIQPGGTENEEQRLTRLEESNAEQPAEGRAEESRAEWKEYRPHEVPTEQAPAPAEQAGGGFGTGGEPLRDENVWQTGEGVMGRAESQESPAAEAPAATPPQAVRQEAAGGGAADDLEGKSVVELRKIAGDLNIKGRSRLKKPDLIQAIRERRG